MRDYFEVPEHEQHPNDGLLLSLLDHELTPAVASELQRHLETCWPCRVRLSKIEDTISAFVDYSEDCLIGEYAEPPNQFRAFPWKLRDALVEASNLEQVEEAGNTTSLPWRWIKPYLTLPASLSGKLKNIISQPGLRPLAGASAFALVLLITWFVLDKPVRTVEASNLLANSQAAYQAIVSAPGRATHRTVTLEERSPATGAVVARSKIEIWQSGSVRAKRLYSETGNLIAGEWSGADGRHAVYQTAKLREVPPASKNPLAADMIWQLTPSAENFRKVVAQPERIQVEEKPEVYVLRYNSSQAGSPKLVRASLTIRRSDLRAIEQTLQVESNGRLQDYRFVEASFEQRPVTEIASAVFSVDSGLLPRPIPAEVRDAGTLSPHLPVVADLQVSVLDLLDKVDALVRNQVSITRTAAGKLLVKGVVASDERKQEILNALGPLAHSPAVNVAISTSAEAEQQQLAGPSIRLQVQEVEVAADAHQGNPDIRRYLAKTGQWSGEKLEQEVNRRSYGAYNHMAEAQLHAMALRQIVESFSAAELNSMDPQTRQQWRALVRKHAEGTQREIRAVAESLAPVFQPVPVKCPQTAPTDLRSAVAQISRIAASADDVIWHALATPSAEESSQLRAPQFWKALDRVERLTNNILNDIQL